MFLSIYKYSFKTLLKDKMTVFWLIFYPLILATLYYFCFTNLLAWESFEKINIAVVEDVDMPSNLITTIDGSDMFNTTKTTVEEANKMLSEGKIDAYIKYNDNLELVVAKEGMNESITKVFCDNYSQISATIKDIIMSNPAALEEGFINNIDLSVSYVKDIPIGNSTNVVVIYFYTVLAMTSLMSATLGIFAVMQIQANQSSIAARINVAPTHKLKSFMTLVASSMTFHIITILTTLIYVKEFLKVDFGNSVGYVLLICLVGSFMGMALGSFISAIIKKKEGIKMAIVLTIIIFGCFLAGMMNSDIKYLIQNHLPIIAYINPASLITDGLYSLYYYNSLTRYFVNLGLLGIYGVVFCLLTYLILRRQKYESI